MAIQVKDATNTTQTMKTTVISGAHTAHHIPEGEILEVLQDIAFNLRAILAQIPPPDCQNNGFPEVKTRLSSSAVTLPTSISFGTLTTVSTVSNVASIGSLDITTAILSAANSDYQSQRDRIVIT